MKAYYAPDDAISEDVRAFENHVTGGEVVKIYLAPEVDARIAQLSGDFHSVNAERWRLFKANAELAKTLRKIMAAASGVSEFHTKEFHRECLSQVRTIALLALEG